MRTLSRKKSNRERLLRNLTVSTILYELITTTRAKAKETQPWIDFVINLGKRDDLASRRRLLAWLPDRNAAKKIWEVLRQRYQDRPSGYSRTYHFGQRTGDGGQRMILELVGYQSAGLATDDQPATKTAADASPLKAKRGVRLG